MFAPHHLPSGRTLVRTGSRRRLLAGVTVAAAALLFVTVIGAPPGARAVGSPVGLGTASGYSVLGGETVTNTGPTLLAGDLGVSPGSAVTGFPPGVVVGTVHASDAVADQAQADLTTAYDAAAGRATTASVSGDLVGQTLPSGVYTSNSSLSLSGTLTLDGEGDPGSVFVFQVASTLITATNSRVQLINGAQACSVYWQVGSSATLGTGSVFKGTLLALASITVNTGVAVEGRALARTGAVTLDSNSFSRPGCDTTTPVTTTTIPVTAPPTTTASTTTTIPDTTITLPATTTTVTTTTIPATTPTIADTTTIPATTPTIADTTTIPATTSSIADTTTIPAETTTSSVAETVVAEATTTTTMPADTTTSIGDTTTSSIADTTTTSLGDTTTTSIAETTTTLGDTTTSLADTTTSLAETTTSLADTTTTLADTTTSLAETTTTLADTTTSLADVTTTTGAATTTPASTTSTTSPATTTSVAVAAAAVTSTSTTSSTVVVTTRPAAVAEVTVAAIPTGRLPATGLDARPLLLLGMALVGLGALLQVRRPRRTAADER